MVYYDSKDFGFWRRSQYVDGVERQKNLDNVIEDLLECSR